MVTQIEAGGSGHDGDRDAGDDDDTRIIFPGGSPGGSDDAATRLIPGRQTSGSEPRGRVIGVAPTAIIPVRSTAVSSPALSHAPSATRSQDVATFASDSAAHDGDTILIPSSRRRPAPSENGTSGAASEPQENTAPVFDPAVGFLVIVDGPGRGTSHPVRYGQNTIGRSATQRICLNYGDPRISREEHAFLIYDETTQDFFIRDNGKANLVRHNDTPVLTPTRLNHRDVISIGDTLMLFIAVCGTDFDWIRDDPEQAGTAPSTDLGATGHEPTGD